MSGNRIKAVSSRRQVGGEKKSKICTDSIICVYVCDSGEVVIEAYWWGLVQKVENKEAILYSYLVI